MTIMTEILDYESYEKKSKKSKSKSKTYKRGGSTRCRQNSKTQNYSNFNLKKDTGKT